ncbi:MAG: hypothetical protein O2992_11315 [Gemmatimonadetes bacterium]|nr:hypothetical protein [Gemmatimonadota bacterium]
MRRMKMLAMLMLLVGLGPQQAPGEDRLYARVTTAAGDEFEGYLRWGANEGSWADMLNVNKEIHWENLREAERLDEAYGRRRDQERSIRFLGLRISWDLDDDEVSEVSSGIRFGHLRALQVVDALRARLFLKSGEEVELGGGSSDVGRSLRALTVDDPVRGEVVLRWRDLERVDFMEAPPGASPAAERIHGTLRTQDGVEFTGFVAWDNDEIFTSDVLDGEEEGTDREVPFHLISAIEQDGRRGAVVILKSAEEFRLTGSNDVNDDNRGIAISDPALGMLVVDWDDFDAITFHSPSGEVGGSYGSFDGGQRLHGSVATRDGREIEGDIRWDNDESFTWEILDGRSEGVDFDIEFDRIDKLHGSGVEVMLRDGRIFEVEGSNDVDDDNKGIFVTQADGSTVLVRWEDFDSVVFAN